MSRIRILSEQLANQIAAGEVVERPASVVKELVENSLDAGASRIQVQVEGSGTRLIRVVDDGIGMDSDDVLLCLERHATSKLFSEDQLAAIATLGFRGEALPSIGSVSRMTILSRPQTADMGTRAEMRYGTLHAIHEDGCRRGTVIEVRGLFGNVPARRKFLKSARTELYHIEEVLRDQALAHPGVGFVLQVEGRTVLDLQPGDDLETRVRQIYQVRDQLVPVSFQDNTDPGLELEGYLLESGTSQSRVRRLRILVNNRPVQDRMLLHGVREGMREFLMTGQQPAGVLLLRLPPDQVDVNVHPAKREIRFRRSQEVHRLLVRGIREAVARFQDAFRSHLFAVPDHRVPAGGVSASDDQPVQRSLGGVWRPSSAPARNPATTGEISCASRPEACSPSDSAPVQSDQSPVSMRLAEPELDAAPETEGQALDGLQVIGQLFDLYLLCQRDDELVLIDQHAAHERIIYQQLRRGFLNRAIPSQSLMFPVPVELGPEQSETMERAGEALQALGFVVEPFGDATWVIQALPAQLSHLDPGKMLHEVLDELRLAGEDPSGAVLSPQMEKLLASMACKAAVKAGNRLQDREMEELLRQMEKADFFSHCPHGRPVIKQISRREIEKWFRRL
ncbi:DNA mismatch repair endonuclease MutL [Desulfolithobacter sp.]